MEYPEIKKVSEIRSMIASHITIFSQTNKWTVETVDPQNMLCDRLSYNIFNILFFLFVPRSLRGNYLMMWDYIPFKDLFIGVGS